MVAGGASVSERPPVIHVKFEFRPRQGSRRIFGMPSTHSSLHIHIVFSTKERLPFIHPEWRHDLMLSWVDV